MLIEKLLALTFVSFLSQASSHWPVAGTREGLGTGPSEPASQHLEAATASKDWIAKATDNICGLRDSNQVSSPAQIDFKACLDATPEMKKVVRDKIDLTTPEGIRLSNEAVNRVTTACETVRIANGYCSVWKTIRHKDARVVSDISEQVKALL